MFPFIVNSSRNDVGENIFIILELELNKKIVSLRNMENYYRRSKISMESGDYKYTFEAYPDESDDENSKFDSKIS
jgi:hypothetical protein